MTQKTVNGERTILISTPKSTTTKTIVKLPKSILIQGTGGFRVQTQLTKKQWKHIDDDMFLAWGKGLFSVLSLMGIGLTVGGCFIDTKIDPSNGMLGAGVTLLVVVIIVFIIYCKCVLIPKCNGN